MHIELIGCTSAGKSTLAGNVLAACRQQGVEILLGDEFVLRQWHLQWVRSRPVRSLLVNGVGLLASLLTGGRTGRSTVSPHWFFPALHSTRGTAAVAEKRAEEARRMKSSGAGAATGR